ncbi:MAG TPA: LysM peptidoglycan-binding domain-containing protein, partial [Candidatus Paceibacterota bacterium]
MTTAVLPLTATAFSLNDFFASADPVIETAFAATPDRNAQTMSLLSPAINIDPNPAQGGGDIAVVGGVALAAELGPSGTAADIEEWPTASAVSVYTVRPGDTLSEIAAMFNVSVNTIVWANDIKGKTIHAGEELVILPVIGLRHTVAKGDTFASLAKKFNAQADDIAQYNGLDVQSSLTVGSTIIIPNGEMPASGETSTAPTHPTKTKHGRITKAPNEPYRGGSGPDYEGYYVWPVDGGLITQGLHGWNAVDIGAPTGTEILAAADGIVIVAKSGGWNGGYGSYIV